MSNKEFFKLLGQTFAIAGLGMVVVLIIVSILFMIFPL